MAIDDDTSYELTGAQVKDLAARIKAAGGGMAVYVDASFSTPSTITGVFSDSAFTTPADPDAMADTISAGGTVVAIYDGGQSEEVIELSSVNSNSRLPEVGQAFVSTISTNAVFSVPTVVTLIYDGTLNLWSADTTAVSAVNNGTLTIQHNGTDVQTFTANQSTNATANIETIYADTITPTTAVASIGTTQIADGAVTNAKLDWSGIIETKTDSSGTTGLYFGDGTLICYRHLELTLSCNTAWGSLYYGATDSDYALAPTNGTDFYSMPTVSVTALARNTASFFQSAWEYAVKQNSSNKWVLPAGAISFLRPTTSASIQPNVDIVAFGRWKA